MVPVKILKPYCPPCLGESLRRVTLIQKTNFVFHQNLRDVKITALQELFITFSGLTPATLASTNNIRGNLNNRYPWRAGFSPEPEYP
jgi:hypothetical protein